MLKRKITSPDVSEPPHGTFTNCFAVGETLYLSGMHADITADGKVAGDASFVGQARQTLRKIKLLVEAGGGTMADVIKVTTYITDISQRAKISDVRREFFEGDFPCSTLIAISGLAIPDLTIEIDAIAVVGAGKKS